MIRRFLLGIFATLFLAGAANALPPSILVGPPTFPPPGFNCIPQPGSPIACPSAPYGGAWFGADNEWISSNTNPNSSVIVFPTTAFNLQSADTLKSWTLSFTFRTPDLGGAQNVNNLNIAGGAGTSACPVAASNKCFGMGSFGNASPGELLLTNESAGGQLWLAAVGANHTGIFLAPATIYTVIWAQFGDDATGGASNGTMSLCVLDQNGNLAGGSCVASSTQNNANPGSGSNFFYSAPGTKYTAATIGALIPAVGQSTATVTTNEHGTQGPISNVMMCNGSLPNTSGTPTLATLQLLAKGQEDPTGWCDAFGTVNTLYRLNDPGTWADSGPSHFANATPHNATGYNAPNGSAFPQEGSPITARPCLRITERGPMDVFRVEPGQAVNASATGTIYVRGTYSTADCHGVITAIQARALSAGVPITPWRTIVKPVAGGSFTGKLSGITVGGPYTYQVRAINSASYIYTTQYPVYIGWNIWVWGRSQLCFMANSNPSGGTGYSLAAASAAPTTAPQDYVYLLLSDSGSNPSNHGKWQSVPLFSLNSANNNQGSTGATVVNAMGDGFMQMMNTLNTQSGWPVKLTITCKSGMALDVFIYDNVPASASLTDTSGTYSMSATNALTALGSIIANTTAGQSPESGFQTVRQGTVQITNGSGTVMATDCNAVAGTNTSSLVGCGKNGFTVTAGTINDVLTAPASSSTAMITGLTFSGGDQGALTIAWTSLQDTQCCTETQQTTYVGYGSWGDGVNATSGYFTQTGLQMTGPLSMVISQNDGGNEGLSSTQVATPPANNNCGVASCAAGLSYQNKFSYAFTAPQKFPAFWWWTTNTPIGIVDFPRDGGAGAAGSAWARQVWRSMFLYGLPTVPNPVVSAGESLDELLACSTSTIDFIWDQAPHPYGGYPTNAQVNCASSSGAFATPVWGGMRWGRRLAMYAIQIQSGGDSRSVDPQITAAAWDNTGTYNASCNGSGGGTNYSCILFTITLHAAGANKIATCGGPTNTGFAANGCVPNTTTGATVCCFRIGTAAATMYNADGIDDGTITGGSGYTVQDNQTFTCTIVANTSPNFLVECAKTSGAWGLNTTYWTYMASGPGNHNALVKSYTINTAGSGQTNNTYTPTASATGAASTCGSLGTQACSCQSYPTANITVSGGQITAITRFQGSAHSGTGYECNGSGIGWTAFTPGGTPGTFTANMFTGVDSVNEIGQALYDNSSASSGPFFCSNAGGLTGATCEPGYPVEGIFVPSGTTPGVAGPM